MSKELMEDSDCSILDTSNPDSLLNRIPAKSKLLTNAVHLVATTDDFKDAVLEKDWKEHFGHSKDYKVMRYLRYSFWNEYRLACELKREINVPRIHAGVCTPFMFNKLMKDELYACYLLSQPQDLRFIQEDLINIGYENIYDILEMPNLDKDGNPNVKLIQQKQKILENLEARRFGSVVHRSQIYQKNENTHITKPLEDASKEELEKQLADLQAELDGKTVNADFVVVNE